MSEVAMKGYLSRAISSRRLTDCYGNIMLSLPALCLNRADSKRAEGRGGASPKIQTHGHEESGETENKMAELNLSSHTGTGSAA